MNVAQYLISIVEKIGVTQGFSLVGGMAMHMNRAAGSGSLTMIYCNHEQAVVAAADGYAKADNFSRPALAIVTSGPGVTNTITSMASAYYDSVPMILLSGQVKSADINRAGVRSFGAQETPHHALLAPITKSSFAYDPAHCSNAELARVLALSMTGRKGPVHVDVPLDVQSQDVKTEQDVEEVVEAYQQALHADKHQASAIPSALLDGLRQAQRPLLVLGNALKIATVAQSQVAALVGHVGVPILLTWASMDLLDHDHPLVFGCAGGLAGTHSNRILQAADFIIFLGTRLDLLTTGYNPSTYGKNAKRFVIDCDGAELGKLTGIPNLQTVHGDVRAVVSALMQATATTSVAAVAPWLAQCRAWANENHQAESQAFATQQLNTFHIAQCIARSPSTRYVVPTASGFAIEGFARFYKTTQGSRFAWAGHVLGSMGLAIPSAVGAAARLHECVACVDGDGGFLLNMQELYTIKANPQLSIALFVLNNKGYASISNSQKRAFQATYGADISSGLAPIDFAPLAEIAGLQYQRCETLDQLNAVVASIAKGSRILVDIWMQDDGYRGPSITTKFDSEGRPYSTPLEEVSWR
jgi:acetolactate synthase-1/2/3 large subunit